MWEGLKRKCGAAKRKLSNAVSWGKKKAKAAVDWGKRKAITAWNGVKKIGKWGVDFAKRSVAFAKGFAVRGWAWLWNLTKHNILSIPRRLKMLMNGQFRTLGQDILFPTMKQVERYHDFPQTREGGATGRDAPSDDDLIVISVNKPDDKSAVGHVAMMHNGVRVDSMPTDGSKTEKAFAGAKGLALGKKSGFEITPEGDDLVVVMTKKDLERYYIDKMGMSPQKAKNMVDSLTSRMKREDDGTWSLSTDNCTHDVMDCLFPGHAGDIIAPNLAYDFLVDMANDGYGKVVKPDNPRLQAFLDRRNAEYTKVQENQVLTYMKDLGLIEKDFKGDWKTALREVCNNNGIKFKEDVQLRRLAGYFRKDGQWLDKDQFVRRLGDAFGREITSSKQRVNLAQTLEGRQVSEGKEAGLLWRLFGNSR